MYITTGLLAGLLDLAKQRDPEAVSAALTTRRAGRLDGPDTTRIDAETPVFAEFYLPSDDQALNAVFGVDITVPHAQTQGRFLSHPRGELTVTMEDDLHEVMVVAVPPWQQSDVAAFNRAGNRRPLEVLRATPPEPGFSLSE